MDGVVSCLKCLSDFLCDCPAHPSLIPHAWRAADNVCPVDANGKFTSKVPDFEGAYVKVSEWVKPGCSVSGGIPGGRNHVIRALGVVNLAGC